MLQLARITKDSRTLKALIGMGAVSSMTCSSPSPVCWSGMPCGSRVSVLLDLFPDS